MPVPKDDVLEPMRREADPVEEPTGARTTWRNAIFFPWDPEARKFKGERVYTDMPRRST